MSEKLSFFVNSDSPIAVYMQIENQVQFAIAAGRVKPGESLPSVREMSTMLGTNPNTVTKAYRDLEIMKLVTTRRGVGVSVTAEAPKLCRGTTRDLAWGHLKDAVAECKACGLQDADILKHVKDTIASGCRPYEAGKK